jgi:hypothetical protein
MAIQVKHLEIVCHRPWSRKCKANAVQGNFVIEPREFWIDIDIEIVIEIDFWQCSDFDSDFDFNELCPTLGIPRKKPPSYRSEIMKIYQRTKWHGHGATLPCIAKKFGIRTFSTVSSNQFRRHSRVKKEKALRRRVDLLKTAPLPPTP